MQIPIENWKRCLRCEHCHDDDEALYCDRQKECAMEGGIMNITQNFLTPNRYSRPGVVLLNVTKIAVHYIGNAGSTAIANRNYFESLKSGARGIYASSHYIIGLDGEIVQCIPENEISYCTNAANAYSISIECCHPAADGRFNEKTNRSLIFLCADLCGRYGLDPLKDLIRHYDVTGKMCPLWHVRNPADWEKLKRDVKAEMEEENTYMVDKRVISVNGKDIETDVIMKDGSTFVKLRSFEKAGCEVGYNEVGKKAFLYFIPVLKGFDVNGVEEKLETVMVDGSNYVKLRELEKIGIGVGYDAVRNMAVLSVPGRE